MTHLHLTHLCTAPIPRIDARKFWFGLVKRMGVSLCVTDKVSQARFPVPAISLTHGAAVNSHDPIDEYVRLLLNVIENVGGSTTIVPQP